MLHNCAPPMPFLNRWLRGAARVNSSYGHLLFEQVAPNDNAVVEELRAVVGDSLRQALISSVVRPQPKHHLLRGSK